MFVPLTREEVFARSDLAFDYHYRRSCPYVHNASVSDLAEHGPKPAWMTAFMLGYISADQYIGHTR